MPAPNPANMVFASKTSYAALMLGYLVLVYAITKGLETSRFGYYLFAIRDNEAAAGAAGVPDCCASAGAPATSRLTAMLAILTFIPAPNATGQT